MIFFYLMVAASASDTDLALAELYSETPMSVSECNIEAARLNAAASAFYFCQGDE